jgi:hypothetical protein
MARKRREYECPPKRCPNPADYAGFPELQAKVRQEWRKRMLNKRSGLAAAQRTLSKSACPGKNKVKRKKQG